MKLYSVTYWIAFILVIVGALNWGLIGFFETDLVALIFGPLSTLSRIVYSLVGLSAYTVLLQISKCVNIDQLLL